MFFVKLFFDFYGCGYFVEILFFDIYGFVVEYNGYFGWLVYVVFKGCIGFVF